MIIQKIKILAICSCILGNRTFTNNLKKILNADSNSSVDYIYLEPQDYATYSFPKWKKFAGMTAESLFVINQKIQNINFKLYDIIIAQGFEIGWAVNNKVINIPCVMLNDATPVISHKLIYQCHHYPWTAKIRSLMFIAVYKIFFKNIFKNIDHFFPRTNWCKKSLVHDFSISTEKIDVRTSIDLTSWPVANINEPRKKIKLLFVGNDFKRKGGKFLLKVYDEISHKAELILISNDPLLNTIKLPNGVTLYKNIPHTALPEYFQDADIFIFPTFKEHLGIVQIEALASGLPIISRDVGGVSDAVQNNYNGYLMPYTSTEEQWKEKILSLIDLPEERNRMGKNSRKLAEEKFSMEGFKNIFLYRIQKLVKN